MRSKILAILLLALAIAAPARADFMLRFDSAFNGAAPASTNAPWMCAWFQDIAPGTVKLTISNLNLTSTESVDALYFNLSPSLNPCNLMLNCFAQGGDFDRPSISLGANQFKADGDGKYDIMLGFTKGGTIWNRFTKYEFLTYSISGFPGLTASDFEFLSAPSGAAGPFYAAAHISRIGNGSQSGWISSSIASPISPVPEPGAGFIFSLGLGLWLAHRVWKRSRLAKQHALKPLPIRRHPN